jgi:hypothetical protein
MRGAMTWRARGCALVIAIGCAGIAGPGTAAAADSLGLEDLAAQIETTVSAELAAAVPQPAAAGFDGGTQGLQPGTAEGTSAEALGTAGPTALAAGAAPPPVDATASGSPPGAPSVLIISVPSAEGAPAPPHTVGPGVLHVLPRFLPHSTRRSVVRTRTSLTVTATARSQTAVSVAQASVSGRARAVSRVSAQARSVGASRPERHSSAPPNREPQPPAPGPDRPDMSSAGQSGGQGLLLPLVLAALAAALALLGLALLPRVLPLPAFRKPRRIVLPPWHPG